MKLKKLFLSNKLRILWYNFSSKKVTFIYNIGYIFKIFIKLYSSYNIKRIMNTIHCPVNKNYYDISSTEGRRILKKYIKYLIGSSQSDKIIKNTFSTITKTTPQQNFLSKNYSKVIRYIYGKPKVQLKYEEVIPKLADTIDIIIEKHGYDLLVYLFNTILFKNIINVKDTFENINCNYEIFNLIIDMLRNLGYKFNDEQFNDEQCLLTADILPNMTHIKKMIQYLFPAIDRNLQHEKRYIKNHLPAGSSSAKIDAINKEIDNRKDKFHKIFQDAYRNLTP